jgi:nitrate reductase alpha subunit
MENQWYDEKFVKNFTDFPLLVRTDTLKRLQAKDVFPNYRSDLSSVGPSFRIQGFTREQHDQLGDFVVWDEKSQSLKSMTRDDIGEKFEQKGIDPSLQYRGRVRLTNGKEVEVMTLWQMYQQNLKDYDLDTVHEITHAPKDLIQRLAKDIATLKPAAIHTGEGINHWFHAVEMNRSTYLPLMLTGNIGKPGSGSHTWAGNYKAGLFQASPWSGPGFKTWVAEDPFNPSMDPNLPGKDIKILGHARGEEPAFWGHGVDRTDTPLKGDFPLIVQTPKNGRKSFTGKSHMPSPSKVLFWNNVNHINNAKWAYGVIKNVNPNVELIISVDIEMTATCELSDFALPANSWMEFEHLEVTASCSNPFLQIWKGGIKPLYDSKDDVIIVAELAAKMGEILKDERYAKLWKFALEGQIEIYLQRLLDASVPTQGYKLEEIMAGKYGEPGVALMNFRTYPRIPFFEQVNDSIPFYTDTGRIHAYSDIDEAIEYGENFIIHREGPEGTPYLPNVIVSTNPYIRPNDYGILESAMDWDERTVRNIKKSWKQVKKTTNPLWKKGYRFYCLTPKSRHRVHSQWAVCDWNLIWDSNFGDPYRMDKRTPGVGEHQIHINPSAAKDLGINDGDYVYVDANPADRPYIGWKPSDPYYKVSRCMMRVKYNPAYPYNIVMMKHGSFIATEKTVEAHETRKDKRALSKDTGYQSNFRYGGPQSITRNWHMPMNQTDGLFHKRKASMSFFFGGETDNHAVNTVPKETLVKITKAEDGGLTGKGIWKPAQTGNTPGGENDFMLRYLEGDLVDVEE